MSWDPNTVPPSYRSSMITGWLLIVVGVVVVLLFAGIGIVGNMVQNMLDPRGGLEIWVVAVVGVAVGLGIAFLGQRVVWKTKSDVRAQ